MMDDRVPVGGRLYFFFLMLLLLSRGADFLSTWIATPNMVLEGNPLARKLGWKWGSFQVEEGTPFPAKFSGQRIALQDHVRRGDPRAQKIRSPAQQQQHQEKEVKPAAHWNPVVHHFFP